MRRSVVVLAVAAAALAMCSAAFATDVDTPYDSDAAARSSFEVPGVVSMGGEASGNTDNDGADSQSTGSSLSVAGTEVASGPSCSASTTAGQNGNVQQSDSGSAQTIGDETTPARVELFSSSCYAHAVSNKNSHASSEGAVATATAPGAGEVVVGRSASSTTTTSGEANSTSSFTFASVTAADTNVTVMECSSEASATNDAESSSSESTFLRSGDTEAAFPDGTMCPSQGAEATHTRG